MSTQIFRLFTVALLAIYPSISISLELNGAGRRIPAPIFAIGAKSAAACNKTDMSDIILIFSLYIVSD